MTVRLCLLDLMLNQQQPWERLCSSSGWATRITRVRWFFMPIQGKKYSKENGSYSNLVCIQFSIPRQAKKNVPSYRSSPHHGAIGTNSPRDDGFRSGIMISTHTSESPEQWWFVKKIAHPAMIWVGGLGFYERRKEKARREKKKKQNLYKRPERKNMAKAAGGRRPLIGPSSGSPSMNPFLRFFDPLLP